MYTTHAPVITSEYLLHYIWRTKQFNRLNLKLTDGRKVEIIDFGKYNTNSGPDFLHGKVRVDDTLLIGHIEMHLSSSDWDLHRHQFDPAYNSVILHVVARHDKEVCNYNDHELITLELGELIHTDVAERYALLQKPGWIPCANLDPSRVQYNIWNIWKERLNIERMQSKVAWVHNNIESTNSNWEEVMYRQLFQAMGTSVNKHAFSVLAERMDFRIFMKNRHDGLSSHALVFGMAGLLEKEFEEEYPLELQRTFRFLQHKYDLTPINPVIWRYSKMHPNNFPDIRIAQIVSLLRQHELFFSAILEQVDYKMIHQMLEIKSLPHYWEDHFILGVPAIKKKKSLGKNTRDLIIINGIIPVLFMYGQEQHLSALQEKALELMSFIPAEQNGIIRQWLNLNISCENAGDSQALLELKNNYCDHQKCLNCSVGHALLK